MFLSVTGLVGQHLILSPGWFFVFFFFFADTDIDADIDTDTNVIIDRVIWSCLQSRWRSICWGRIRRSPARAKGWGKLRGK